MQQLYNAPYLSHVPSYFEPLDEDHTCSKCEDPAMWGYFESDTDEEGGLKIVGELMCVTCGYKSIIV